MYVKNVKRMKLTFIYSTAETLDGMVTALRTRKTRESANQTFLNTSRNINLKRWLQYEWALNHTLDRVEQNKLVNKFKILLFNNRFMYIFRAYLMVPPISLTLSSIFL